MRKRIFKIIIPTALLILLAAVFYFAVLSEKPLSPCEADSGELLRCFKLQKSKHADWRFLYTALRNGNVKEINDALKKAPPEGTDTESLLAIYGDTYGEDKDKQAFLRRLWLIDDIAANGSFPLENDAAYTMENTWGGERTYGGKRTHEGTDIICEEGTPVCAVSSGVVSKKGWNELGGYRIGITDKNGIYYYYAHFSRYAKVDLGDEIRKGQVIGYAGSTGYGPEGTEGKFVSHLHFGLYYKDKAFNPYPYLVYWED